MVGIAFGVQTVFGPAVIAVGFAVVTLVWTAYRRDYHKQTLLGQRRRYSWQPVASAVGVLVLASGSGRARCRGSGPTSRTTRPTC